MTVDTTRRLDVTFIDVGWGDSIFLEHYDAAGNPWRALIDSNDSSENLSSYTFVKQHFELSGVAYGGAHRPLNFVLLTHWHTDHYSGLKRIMQTFGTRRFWYPKTDPATTLPAPLQYANRSNSRVDSHQAVDRTKVPTGFGEVEMRFHWPPHTTGGPFDTQNKNNNSVVLELKLDDIRFFLTGDCEAPNWAQITPGLSRSWIRLFQAPHHGAQNGMFHGNATPWLDWLGRSTRIALSSHIHPHHHPHPRVIGKLEGDGWRHFRTDEHYHVTFRTVDGRTVRQKWARF